MTTKTKNSKKRNNPNYKARRIARIFRINTESAIQLQKVITAAWSFATASLWNKQQFSEAETVAAKIKIGSYFLNEPDKDAALNEFCQRILLAKDFLNPVIGGTLPQPSAWFDENNPTGYAATIELYRAVVRQRDAEPAAMTDLKVIADAVTGFYKNPVSQTYRLFKQDLLLIKAPDMALLFQVFAANLWHELH